MAARDQIYFVNLGGKMSKIIATCAIRGAREIYRQAEEFLEKSIKEKGEACEVKFPETAFYFPMAYALLGEEIKKLSDAKKVLLTAKTFLHEDPSEKRQIGRAHV